MDEHKVPWTIREAAVALVLFIAILIGGSFIAARFFGRLLPQGGMVVAIFVSYGFMFLLIWYLLARRKAGFETLGFRPFDFRRALGLAVAWFFLSRFVAVIYALILQALGIRIPDDIVRNIPQMFGEGVLGFLLAFVAIVVVAPVVEEMFFRGFLFAALRKYWGFTAAALTSAVVFAVFHNPYSIVPIAVIGYALAYLYEETDSLWAPIMLHALNNFVSVVLIYYIRSVPLNT